MRKFVPWWLRIVVKIVLARLPIPYSVWKRLRVFEHGFMDDPQRALQTFLAFAETAGLLPDRSLDRLRQYPHLLAGKSVLELGPGDSLFTALIASSVGSAQTWLVDSGNFATRNVEPYTAMTVLLDTAGLDTPWRNDTSSIDSMLRSCACNYLTDGIASLRHIPSGSIDFCFSNAVLEHIPRLQFVEFVDQLHRVLSPDGIAVHRVDLTDHLGGGLNNLRFSDAVWESRFFTRSGFYTNRLRFSEITNAFRSAGFDMTLPRIMKWDALPLAKSKLHRTFSSFVDDDLLVYGFDVLIRTDQAGGVGMTALRKPDLAESHPTSIPTTST